MLARARVRTARRFVGTTLVSSDVGEARSMGVTTKLESIPLSAKLEPFHAAEGRIGETEDRTSRRRLAEDEPLGVALVAEAGFVLAMPILL